MLKSLDECKQVYEQHIKACYINNAYRPRLDSLICAITGNDRRYTNTKIVFIGMVREKIYNMLVSVSFVRLYFNKSGDYLEACQNQLKQDVFADEHDKHGVSEHFKHKLQERIREIEETLQLNEGFEVVTNQDFSPQ